MRHPRSRRRSRHTAVPGSYPPCRRSQSSITHLRSAHRRRQELVRTPMTETFLFLIEHHFSCKEVNVEEDRYQPFVELFNNILQETEKIKVVGLCNPSLNILFHLSDPSIVHALHNGMKTSRKPDIGATQLDTAKSRALSEDKYLTWKEFTVTRALAKPKTSFSWSDFLAVAEFKLGLKSCHDPPEKYGEQLTKTIPPTENVYGPLHTTSVAKTSALPTASKSRAAPPTQPLNIFEMTKQKKGACFCIFIHGRSLTSGVIQKPGSNTSISGRPRRSPRRILGTF